MPRRVLFPLLGLVAGAATLALLFGSVEAFHAGMDFDDGALLDFKEFYYPTGRTVLETGQATPGFLYPPSFALALVPLGRLDLELATSLWLGLQLLATLAVIGLGLVLVRPGPRLAGLWVFSAVTCVPLAHNLHWGQVSVLLGVLVLTAVACEQRGWRDMAVLSIAVAASIKLYPVLFLLIPLRRGEGARAARGLLFTALLVVALPSLWLGPGPTVDMLRDMGRAVAARRELFFDQPNAQALGPVLARWLGLGGTVLAWAGGALALAQLPFLRRVADDPLRAYAAVAVTLPLVVEPHWPHYFALLPFVQLVCLARGDRLAQGLAVASCVLSSLVVFRAFQDPEAYGAAGLLLVADLLLLLALRRT